MNEKALKTTLYWHRQNIAATNREYKTNSVGGNERKMSAKKSSQQKSTAKREHKIYDKRDF